MLAFAPYVQECIGIDATQEMVDVASSFAEEKAAVNVHFQKGTASDEGPRHLLPRIESKRKA